MAATLALIAVVLPSGAPPYMARNMAIGHGVLVALSPPQVYCSGTRA